MNDLEKAKQIFLSEKCTLVLAKGDTVIIESDNSLKALIQKADNGEDFTDFTACINYCGRAAAFLFVLLGVKHVHASKMAKLSPQILDRAEITFSQDEYLEDFTSNAPELESQAEEAVLRSGSAIKALEDLKNLKSLLS